VHPGGPLKNQKYVKLTGLFNPSFRPAMNYVLVIQIISSFLSLSTFQDGNLFTPMLFLTVAPLTLSSLMYLLNDILFHVFLNLILLLCILLTTDLLYPVLFLKIFSLPFDFTIILNLFNLLSFPCYIQLF